MIPAGKNAAVFKGLEEAFGTTTIEDIRSINEGSSSDLVFRIVVNGTPYLLRIMTRIDERMDPARIFARMNAAAEAGVAPRVRYTNADEGITITEFIAALPLETTQARVQLPATLAKLHRLPPFPKAFNYVTAHNGFIWRLRKASLLPQDEVEEVFGGYQHVCAIYPRLDSDMVSCHMDLKPENIVFDGQRVWLLGWQAAFLNDRYFDLAVAANYLVNGDGDESIYLAQYFAQSPGEYQRARFFLMRQVVHMLSAAVFLLLGAAGKPINPSENLPSFRDFHRQIWEGKLSLASNDLKIVCGLVHWKQLLENLRSARFHEALAIVSAANSGDEPVHPLLPAPPQD